MSPEHISEMDKIYEFASKVLNEFKTIENDSNFILSLSDNNLYYDFDRAYHYLDNMVNYASTFINVYGEAI